MKLKFVELLERDCLPWEKVVLLRSVDLPVVCAKEELPEFYAQSAGGCIKNVLQKLMVEDWWKKMMLIGTASSKWKISCWCSPNGSNTCTK